MKIIRCVYAIIRLTTLAVGLMWPMGHILSFLHIYKIPHDWMQLSRTMAMARLAMFAASVAYGVTRRKPGVGIGVAVTEQVPPIILRLARAEFSIYRKFYESIFEAKDISTLGFSFCDGPRFREFPYVVGLSFLIETPILYFIVRYESRPEIHTLMDAAIVGLTLRDRLEAQRVAWACSTQLSASGSSPSFCPQIPVQTSLMCSFTKVSR